MKRILLFTSIIALLCSACSNNDDEGSSIDPAKTTKASLTVNLEGIKSSTTRAVGTPTQAQENEIHSFTVYVFANSILEKSATSTTLSGLSLFIDNLTTGAKDIVVVANAPSTFPTLNEGDPYSSLASATRHISLDDQVTATTNGLVMSGQVEATLQAESAGTNNVTVPISRIVAKIKLGTITVVPAAGTSLSLFQLTGVAIIKAKSSSSVGIPSIVTTQPFYSGIEGISVHGSNIKTYLYENITLSDHANRFFYIFANDNSPEDATLLTLEGVYNNEVMYFPFRLPTILRNTQHTLDITIRRIASGSPDPEIPSDPATLTVTITPQNWVVVPTQAVEW